MLRPVNSSAIRLTTGHLSYIDSLQWMGGVIGEGTLVNERPAVEDTRRAFAKFSPHELAFMSLRGIPIIDLQDGCPNQCFACACDAERLSPRNSMSPTRIKAFLRAARGLKTLGYNLFPDKHPRSSYPDFANHFSLLLFFGSDLINYHAHDEAGSEWTMYDALNEFQASFGVPMVFTTSGWKPGDNFRSRAVAQLNDRMAEDEQFKIGRAFSLKMLGRRARHEYDHFMEVLVEQKFSVSVEQLISTEKGLCLYDELSLVHVDDFVRGSKHVASMVDNIRELLRGGTLAISAGSLSFTDRLALPYYRYRHLFSTDMIERVRMHCVGELGADASKLKFESRGFVGVTPRSVELLGGSTMIGYDSNLIGLERGLLSGTEVDDSAHSHLPDTDGPDVFRGKEIRGSLSRSARAVALQLGWKQPDDIYLDLYRFYSMVSHRGAVSVWYGKQPSSFENIPVPREYFVARAEHHEGASSGNDDHATMARHYRMLAGLIGKNIFG